MRYDYDMLGNRIHQASMEAGERWMLNDCHRQSHSVLGQPRPQFPHRIRLAAPADRPVRAWVLTTSTPIREPPQRRCSTKKRPTAKGNPPALNLRTRIFQQSTPPAWSRTREPIPSRIRRKASTSRATCCVAAGQFVADYKALPDWSAPPPTPDVFTSSTQYDALNRPVALTTPDGSVVRPTYNEANLLERVDVNLRGAATGHAIRHQYRLQRQGPARCSSNTATHANTDYTYDPLTFRLGPSHDHPARDSPAESAVGAGSILHLRSCRQHHPHPGRRRHPERCLLPQSARRAQQRLHLRRHLPADSGHWPRTIGTESAADSTLPPTPSSYNDVPRVALTASEATATRWEHTPNNIGTMRSAISCSSFIKAANPANPGWTRSYTYNEASLLDPGKVSNRLTGTP